jgi:Flp pilus assembly pilin Flp
MNEEMNTPVSPEPEGISGWFATWMQAITKPNEQTFVEIASSPNVKTSTAFLWVFIGSLLNSFILYLAQGALISSMLSDFSDGSMFGNGAGFSLIGAICGAPVAAVISVLVFAIFTGVTQWVAKMFGGTGTFEKLAYTFAAITVPFSLISAILGLLALIPYIGFCFGILTLGLAIYVLVLEIMAVKGVNQFGYGAAIGSIFIPGLVIVVICVCVFGVGSVAIMRLLGPKIGNTFSSINSSLP